MLGTPCPRKPWEQGCLWCLLTLRHILQHFMAVVGCKMSLSHQLPSRCQGFLALEEVIREHRYATEASFVPANGGSPLEQKRSPQFPQGFVSFLLPLAVSPSSPALGKVQGTFLMVLSLSSLSARGTNICFFPSCRAGELLKGWVFFSGNRDP